MTGTTTTFPSRGYSNATETQPPDVPSFMSSALASAAVVGIFAAGPDTPTRCPERKRISSVVPTCVPSRVIMLAVCLFCSWHGLDEVAADGGTKVGCASECAWVSAE